MNTVKASAIGFKKIRLCANDLSVLDLSKLSIKNGQNYINIKECFKVEDSLVLDLSDNINIKYPCDIIYENISEKVNYIPLYISDEFNERFYTDLPLGCRYSLEETSFSLWSPIAASVNLLVYKSGDNKEDPRRFLMEEKNGLWTMKLKEDLKGYFYTYEVTVHGQTNEAVDPYAYASGINGLRGAIIDLNDTNPEGFHLDISPTLKNFTDAVIYETSIRDISICENSGISLKGKFLGLAEENTKSNKGLSTGLNHIKELGVTHIQLMPMFDISFNSIDEKDPVKYNWGYDPQNYNVPEGSYSTNPYNPVNRIYELKKLIQTLHRNNLCVNMDVVYNHLFHQIDNNFEKIFPGYYLRFNEDGSFSNGSGCSNDTASENPMMRRFIIDSIMYWATEYHMDGFRFDLMGLHDTYTMNLVRDNLDKLERNIMLYGEGWDLSTALPKEKRAAQLNNHKMPRIGHFNDTLRDGVKGSVFFSDAKGFVNGKDGLEELIRKSIVGSIKYRDKYEGIFQTPEQSINYVSCHDNNTLWDKLELTEGKSDIELLKAMDKLANAIVLTCQGIPFIHSGEEFCRTKNGIENSYISPDSINQIDWYRKENFMDVFEYYKGLIKLRNNHPAFRMNSKELIDEHIHFLDCPNNTVAFMIKGNANSDSWKNILVIYNANKDSSSIQLPDGDWNVVVDKYTAGTDTLRTVTNIHQAYGISISVLYQI